MVVLAVLPRTDLLPGLAERREQDLVQHLTAEPTAEAFHEAVPYWFAQRDVRPFNTGSLTP